MKQIGNMTQAELAAYVQSSLRDNHIEVVLSGGAVVVIYKVRGNMSRWTLTSYNARFAEFRDIEQTMERLGFTRIGRHFVHPATQYYVEFPPGPLTVGERKIAALSELHLDTGILRLLSPTDCVLDRLAHYYHWGDRQALTQAELVASRHQVDLDEVIEWSRSEGKLDKFHEIKNRLVAR